MSGESILKAPPGSVVRLSRISSKAADRGEKDEEIRIQQQFMKIPAALDLRTEGGHVISPLHLFKDAVLSRAVSGSEKLETSVGLLLAVDLP